MHLARNAGSTPVELKATFLARPRNEIHKLLAGTRAYPLVDPQAHEQGAGILATAANAVKPFPTVYYSRESSPVCAIQNVSARF